MPDDPNLEALFAEIPDPVADRSGASASPRAIAPSAPSLTRAQVRQRKVVAAVAAAGVPIATALVLHIHPSENLSTETIVKGCMLWLALASLAYWTGLRSGPRSLGASAMSMAAVAIGLPLAFAAVALGFGPAGGPGSASAVLECLSVTVALAVGPVVVMAMTLRRTMVCGAAWRGAALGVAAGAVGAGMMGVVCPGTGAHIALAHGLPIFVMAAVGGVIGRFVARV